jgi:hypothetical protein
MTETVRLANTETGPTATPVTDQEVVKALRNVVLGYWPKRKNDFFPGPQPVSLERRDLFKLRKFPYLVCVKSNGMRFMMLCTTVNEQLKCFMIDRAFRFFEVNQCFDKAMYTNTLFDGELVKSNSGVWTYIVHDCVSFRGDDVSQMDFNKRYSYVSTAVETFWEITDSNVFPIEIKKFVPFTEIKTLVEMEAGGEITHPTDGYIFTPVMLPIGTNAQYTLFKWKSAKFHTFDFKVTDEQDRYIAHVNKKGSLVPFASVTKTTKQGIEFGRRLSELKDPVYKSGEIVECEYDTKSQCFNPLFVRTDKTHPNGLYTVEKTLLNIQENITIDELSNLKMEH